MEANYIWVVDTLLRGQLRIRRYTFLRETKGRVVVKERAGETVLMKKADRTFFFSEAAMYKHVKAAASKLTQGLRDEAAKWDRFSTHPTIQEIPDQHESPSGKLRL